MGEPREGRINYAIFFQGQKVIENLPMLKTEVGYSFQALW
jgi:hypothetical protein